MKGGGEDKASSLVIEVSNRKITERPSQAGPVDLGGHPPTGIMSSSREKRSGRSSPRISFCEENLRDSDFSPECLKPREH